MKKINCWSLISYYLAPIAGSLGFSGGSIRLTSSHTSSGIRLTVGRCFFLYPLTTYPSKSYRAKSLLVK